MTTTTTFKVEGSLTSVRDIPATLITVGFADPGTNQQIVVDAVAGIDAVLGDFPGGRLALITGPASLPAAVALGHKLVHRFGAVACFDPKLQGFVVSVSHDPAFTVGDLISL